MERRMQKKNSSWQVSISSTSTRCSRTDTFNTKFDPGTQNFVPPINTPYQPPTALKTARPAERVYEGGIGRKIGFYRAPLLGGRGLCEGVNYGGDFGGGVFHAVFVTVVGGVGWRRERGVGGGQVAEAAGLEVKREGWQLRHGLSRMAGGDHC